MFSESLPPGARPPGLAAGEEAVPLGDTPRHLDGVSVPHKDTARMANAAPLSSFDSRRPQQSRGARSHLHLQQSRSQRQEDRVLRTSAAPATSPAPPVRRRRRRKAGELDPERYGDADVLEAGPGTPTSALDIIYRYRYCQGS